MRPTTHDRYLEFRDLHLATFHEYEFTKQLGIEYLTLFFDYLLSCGMAFGFYYEFEGKVIAYCVGYLNRKLLFENFHRKYCFRLIKIWAKLVFNGFPLPYIMSGIMQLLFSITDKKTRKVADPRAHLGFIALRKDYQGTPEGREMVKSCIQAVLEEHVRLGYKGTWGGIDSRNIKMVKMLERLGMSQVDLLHLPGREIVIMDIVHGNS